MLIKLFVDYAGDEGLRTQFADDPEGVLMKYDISREVRAMLREGERKKIKEQLESDVNTIFAKVGSLHGGGTHNWCAAAEITSVDPSRIKVGERGKLTVRGKYFSEKPIFIFYNSSAEFKGKVEDVKFPESDDSEAIVRVRPTSSGEYHLKMGEEGTDNTVPLKYALTAED